MVIDAHLNNVNNVHNMKNKKILWCKQLEVKLKPLTHKSMTAHFRFKHENSTDNCISLEIFLLIICTLFVPFV
jgi:hypothetical protein